MDTLSLPDTPLRLFADYMSVTGVPHLKAEPRGDPALVGKRLGLLNGSSWITLWCNYFGKLYLPGVQLVNAGSDAVQLSFMEAHSRAEPCPPPINIQVFVRMARDLVELADVNAILITCSTMNRSYAAVTDAVDVPVVQIDMPLMEAAINHGGKILVVATHGPTVKSTQALLLETAGRMGVDVAYTGTTVEAAWHRLAEGDVQGHNALLAEALRAAQAREALSCALLAQLSMSVFALSYPDTKGEFGIPVFTSAQTGFQRVRELLA